MEPFTIGRNEKNHYALNHKTVSGVHAEVAISNDFKSFVLKDLDSSNGTKVNGRRIVTKILQAKDKIEFGETKVLGKDLIARVNKYVIKNRQDFSTEFSELKMVEKNFKTKKDSIRKYFKLQSLGIRILITAFVIVLINNVLEVDREVKTILTISAGLMGTVLATLSATEKKQNERLEELQDNYYLSFLCPKCKMDLSKRSWNYWKNQEKCPKCKCDWVAP
ncbi:MAG: FHA domain-containing protein [Bacteroidota bacterium]